MRSTSDRLSVITLQRDRIPHLRRLVTGLVRSVERPAELIVVNLSPDDDQIAALRYLDAAVPFPVTVIQCPVDDGDPLPLAHARNLGGDRARTDRLLFLDVDCIPDGQVVGRCMETPGGMIANPGVRYLGANWVDDTGAQSGVPSIDALMDASEWLPIRHPPHDDMVDHDHDRFWSLAFALDRRTWERVGGFDERYVGYGAEDTDFGRRAATCDVPMLWLADANVFHQWHMTESPPVHHLADIVRNSNLFWSIWQRWPMEGWLRVFAERGLIAWEPTQAIPIEVAAPADASGPSAITRS